MASLKWKLNVKSLGEKCQAFRNIGKGPETKTLMKMMMYPLVKPSSTEITNVLNTLQNLFRFNEVRNDVLELLQRFESLYVHDQLENNLAFWLTLTENKISITVEILIYSETSQ